MKRIIILMAICIVFVMNLNAQEKENSTTLTAADSVFIADIDTRIQWHSQQYNAQKDKLAQADPICNQHLGAVVELNDQKNARLEKLKLKNKEVPK
ncbi:MAG: hypothetical protein A2V66_03745 [Ignavibacteria bacterium RBG_13_36_8]|nr:MAG: hypothetical protein A2V66_03745 [Ignavibacteria bacterium RBG_13_36_8]